MAERSVLGGRKRRLILSDSESEEAEEAPGVVRRIRWDEPSRYMLVRRGEGEVEYGGLEEEVRAGLGFGSEKRRVSGGERMEKRCGGLKKDGYLEGERSSLRRNIDLEGERGLRKNEILEEGSGLKKNNNLEGKRSDLKRNGIFEGEGSRLKKNINLEGEKSGVKRNNNLKGEGNCLKKNSSLEGERSGLKKNFDLKGERSGLKKKFDLKGERSGLKKNFDLGRQRSGLKKNYGLERERSNSSKRNHIGENNLKRRVILKGDKRSLRKDNVFKEERSDSKRNRNVDGERSRLKGGFVVERERSDLKKNLTTERSNLKRNYFVEGGSGSSNERSARKIRKMVDDSDDEFDCLSRQDPVFSGDEKVIRVQGRSGVLKFLPGGKKVGNQEKIRMSEDASTSGERAVHGNAGHLKGCGSYFEQEKSLAPKKGVILQKVGNLSLGNAEPRINNAKDVTNVKGRQGSYSTPKKANLVQKNIRSEKPNRTTEKQKLRDQLRDILLNAGWKIEMRPRKNRCYEDAVYVSPQGTGYWSITKAYAVFSEQMKLNGPSTSTVDESMLTPNKNHMNAKNSNSLCSTIPVDALKILKRNVVNKRGGKKCHDIGDDNHGDRFKGKSATKKFTIETNVKSCSSAALDSSGSSSDSEDNPGEAIVKRKGCKLLIRNSNQGLDSDGDEDEDEDYVPYLGKRTVLAWLIDSGFVCENGIVKYMNKGHTMPILKGRITRDGIHCNCCYEILPVTEFEIHAGSQLCQPYLNIFVEDRGCTLSQCLEDVWNNQDKPSNFGFASVDDNGDDPDDDTCGICGDGGDLICCDGCPSTFHLSCLDVEMLPPGEWLCSYCSCRFCGLVNSTSRHEISTSELLSCSQCEEKYHHCCTPMEDSLTDSCNSRPPFCGEKCKKLYKELQKLLGQTNKLEDGFSWSLIQREDSTLTSQVQCARRAECNAKLAVALSVMDECFLPTVDQRSDVKLIHNVVYNFGSNFKRLNYSGFYTFILERGDEIIAAASVRIHGTRLAEMPFIGTRDMYRRRGMCRRLLTAIEMALFSLGVEKLVIPAISELRHTWTEVFGFKPLDGSSMKELKSVSLLVFPDTGLLQKSLSRHEVCKAAATEGNDYRLAIRNDFPCHSHGESDCATEKTSLCHLDSGKDEIKDSTCSSSEVLFDLSDVPHHSGYTSSQSCQPEKTKEMTSQSDFVHNAPVLESHSSGNASPISEIQLPHESITGSTDEVKFGDTSIVSANASGIPKQPTSSSGGTLKSADSISPTSHGRTSCYKICA